ncbi:MAG TPA: ParB/RepB/Spo0J family partition protein [Candidatus Magasanikbacteria bacterium]|jgi:ParB family chromosome partitioning protein|nr:ParB/RepB/Spo0J family partition protein [Candidatus Magasanikbacteria bacterium]HQF57118.1 ParB/RepB/Spo0J family partition protein [Candidatus Magasanikbacteria bacterium]HQL52896.1 ParB/RepB/Spo0J family partition protein [Candidatus Magasanikbacteria bacterium]
MALGKGLNSLIPQQKTRKIIRHETGIVNGEGRIWDVSITEIAPNSEQPRKEFSHQELEDLVSSIKKHGILQPLVITEKADGGYELIAGERRLRASQIAGLATVPAIIRSVSQQEKLELALIENIQRQNLNAIEEAFAYRRLIDEFNLTQEKVAEQVGKARSTIANLVRLLDLPEIVQKALVDKKISVGQAKALLSLNSEKEQISVLKSMLGEKMTVREVENVIQNRPVVSRKGSVRRDPNIIASERILEEALGTKVHITQKGNKGKIEIEYYSAEDLKRLINELS